MTTRKANVILSHLRRLCAGAEEDTSDSALLRRYGSHGDEEAFAQLLSRHRSLVQGVALRMLGSWHDSEDVVQATFVVLARKAATLGQHPSVVGWLYRTAYHLALKVRDAARRRQRCECRGTCKEVPDPSDDIRLSEARALIDAELDAMSERYRLPILLCCLGARTRDEAARQLGWSLATLKRRLTRGRELLAQRLARRGLTLSAVLTSTLFAPEPSAMAGGPPSQQAMALAEGMLRAMTVAKRKMMAALLLAASALAAGAGVLLCQVSSEPEVSPSTRRGDRQRPEEPPQAQKDRYGDPLPAGAITRLGTTRLRHFGRIFDVAFSPDGTLLASVGEDRRIRLWEAATGRQLRQLPGYFHVAFSPNGKMLASNGEDGTIRLWDVATGQPVGKPIQAYRGFLGFSPDGSILALTKVINPSPSRPPTETAIALWEIATARVIRTWTIKASVYAGTFAPDGQTLAVGTNDWEYRQATGVLSLWETATGKERWRSAQGKEGLLSVAFAADGKSLVSVGDYFDPATNEHRGTVTFWDAARGKELRKLPGLVNRVDCVRFSADGRYLATICGQGPTILWDLKVPGGPRRLWQVPDNGYSVAFAPDGRRFAWATRQAIRLLDLPPKEYDPRGGHAGSWPSASPSIPFVAFTSDGKGVVSVGDRVRLWNADTGGELRVAAEVLTECSAAALSLHGKTLITGSRGSTTLWDLDTLKPLRTFATPNDYVLAMALSPDGNTLATTLEHTLTPAEQTGRFPAGTITRSREMMVRLWDVKTGKEKRQIGKGTHAPQLAFSPDGKRLACVTMYQEGIIRLWDTKTGEVSLDLKSRTRWGPGQALLCFSPDGKLLASADEDDAIRLWDAHLGNSVRVLRGHPGRVFTLVFSPDGKTLLSGGDDEMLRLWDVATGKLLHELHGHLSAIVAAAFSPDGKRIASASQDTTILIWDVPALAKRVQPPPLTEEELACLWSDLGAQHYYLSEGVIRRVKTAPGATVAYLKERLKPDLPRGNRLARLLDDLDSDSFVEREKASRELARMVERVGPVLRRVLAEDISPEARRRVQALVATLPRPQRPPHGIAAEERRLLNTVVLLDRIGTAEALELLHYLSRSSELSALLSDRSIWEGELREARAAVARRAKDSSKP